MTPLLYLDQNYLSGIAKRKRPFVELEAVLRPALARGAVAVVESTVHERESLPRPDLGLIELLRGLSAGRRLPAEPSATALAIALEHCELVTCDAFMADVIRRTRLDLRHGCELFGGRWPDVLRLRDRLAAL